MEFIFSKHALIEISRRELSKEIIEKICISPEQKLVQPNGRVVFQSKIDFNEGMYLVRVIIDQNEIPNKVITAYKTSKINKYWRI